MYEFEKFDECDFFAALSLIVAIIVISFLCVIVVYFKQRIREQSQVFWLNPDLQKCIAVSLSFDNAFDTWRETKERAKQIEKICIETDLSDKYVEATLTDPIMIESTPEADYP